MFSQAIWKNKLISLASLFQDVAWGTSTREVYQGIANKLIDIAGCDSVNIRLIAMSEDEMIGYVFAGEAETITKRNYPILSINVGKMVDIFRNNSPIIYDFNNLGEGEVLSKEGIELGYSHAVIIPMMVKGSLVGTIDFLFKEGQFNDEEDLVTLLIQTGRIIGPISSSLSRSEKMVEIRVGDEAKRIGSELHDNFAQPLSIISLEADKAQLSAEENDNVQLMESLKRIASISRQAVNMMTQEVAMLHSASGKSEDLLIDVKEYVESFSDQWGIEVELDIPEERVLVSNNISNQAMRILHEALSNVLRHSMADHVMVKIASNQAALELCVEDNGCGFDPKSLTNEQLGLRIMEERAQSIGGRLTIASVLGEGTSVCADLPLIA